MSRAQPLISLSQSPLRARSWQLRVEQPFVTPCATGDMVIALAPTDPNALSTGPIPAQDFVDLIAGRAASEGGFLAATQSIGCP